MRLVVFVPGVLKNMANVRVHYMRKAAYAKNWRTNVKLMMEDEMRRLRWAVAPEVPKRITLVAHVARTMDRGGLSRALKPIEDALTPDVLIPLRNGKCQHRIGCGVISDDAESHGHTIIHEQVVDRRARAIRGVEITAELL